MKDKIEVLRFLPIVTQSKFIKGYCERSFQSEEALNQYGLYAIPCKCNNENCEGWQMTTESGNIS